MPEPIPIFSDGANDAIATLDPGGRPEGQAVFPPRCDWGPVDQRVSDGESLGDWFRGAVGPESMADERIGRCGIERTMALFARVCWTQKGITCCRMQALITCGGELTDFYQEDEQTKGTYYRLDLNPTKQGHLFAEPLPHVHCCPHGPPRFPFVCPDGEYLPAAFLEFLYLNHHHDTWLKWARRVCSLRGGSLSFPSIAERYALGAAGPHQSELAADVAKLRTILQQAKRHHLVKAPGIDSHVLSLNCHVVGDGC